MEIGYYQLNMSEQSNSTKVVPQDDEENWLVDQQQPNKQQNEDEGEQKEDKDWNSDNDSNHELNTSFLDQQNNGSKRMGNRSELKKDESDSDQETQNNKPSNRSKQEVDADDHTSKEDKEANRGRRGRRNQQNQEDQQKNDNSNQFDQVSLSFQTEIKPDVKQDLDTSNWDLQQNDTQTQSTASNRGNRAANTSRSPPKRGNRRGNRDPPAQNMDFKKKPSNCAESDRNDNRNMRRGRGTGRGGFHNNNNNNRYGNRNNPNQNDFGRNSNQYDNSRYDNRQKYPPYGYNEDNRYRPNEPEGFPQRANHYIPKDNDPHGNGGFRRANFRENAYRQDRDYYQPKRNNDPATYYSPNRYNDQPNYYQPKRYNDQPPPPPSYYKQPEPQAAKTEPAKKPAIEEPKLQIKPRGQKCWPEVSMYVYEKKLCFGYRQIAEHIEDVLIIPYVNMKFQVYPGNLVNKFKVNYRNKIQNKGDSIKKIGHTYMQKCIGFDNFKAIGFLYLGDIINPATYVSGILEAVNKIKFSSILIPYSSHLGTSSINLTNMTKSSKLQSPQTMAKTSKMDQKHLFNFSLNLSMRTSSALNSEQDDVKRAYKCILFLWIIFLLNMHMGNTQTQQESQKKEMEDKEINANQNANPQAHQSIGINDATSKDKVKQEEQSLTQDLQVSDFQAFKSVATKEQILPIFQFVELSVNNQIKEFSKISALRCTRRQLVRFATDQFCKNEWGSKKLGKGLMEQLIEKIAQGYHNVSYHNFSHGFTLMQIFHGCLDLDKHLSSLLNEEQKILYFFAGLAHDINHRGTNNQFEIALKTKLAEEAKNVGVLELMHANTFFQLLRDNPHLDIISKSSNPHQSKQLILQAILATDMGQHSKHLQEMKQKRQTKTLDLSLISDRQLVVNQIFHASDIGTGTLQFQQLMNWSCLLMSEFDHQTKIQAQKNIPVTQFMKYQSKKDFFKGQTMFLNSMVLPLWKQISLNFVNLTKIAGKIEQNSNKFRELSEKETEQK